MRFDIWKHEKSMLDHLNEVFDPRFSECCGCGCEMQGDELEYEFSDGQPGKFPVCLDCIPSSVEDSKGNIDKSRLQALRNEAERRAIELLGA